MSTLLPTLLLLFWSGLAATLIALGLFAPLLGEGTAALGPETRRPSVLQSLLGGTIAYPVAYGVAFQLLGQANLASGALAGLGHAALLALLSLRQGGMPALRNNAARVLLCLAYGVLIGFFYVTP